MVTLEQLARRTICRRCGGLSVYRSHSELSLHCKRLNKYLGGLRVQDVPFEVDMKEWYEEWNLDTKKVMKVFNWWCEMWPKYARPLPAECPLQLEHLIARG